MKNYNRFINQVIKVKISKETFQNLEYLHEELEPNQIILKEIEEQSRIDNFSLRILLPSTRTSASFVKDRLNVYITKDKLGIYKITKFGLG